MVGYLNKLQSNIVLHIAMTHHMGTPKTLILIFIAVSNVQPQRIFYSYTVDTGGKVALVPTILLERGQRRNTGWPY